MDPDAVQMIGGRGPSSGDGALFRRPRPSGGGGGRTG